jgi:hypothetical protein
MHKGIRQLTSDTSGGLTYDQAGFDMMSVDHNTVAGKHHTIFKAGAGTDIDNIYHQNIPTNKTPHWIGIHNCGSFLVETCSIQAESIVGDDLSKSGTYNPLSLANYVEIIPGDIIYGKFTQVALVKTDSGVPIPYVDILRLIRGV